MTENNNEQVDDFNSLYTQPEAEDNEEATAQQQAPRRNPDRLIHREHTEVYLCLEKDEIEVELENTFSPTAVRNMQVVLDGDLDEEDPVIADISDILHIPEAIVAYALRYIHSAEIRINPALSPSELSKRVEDFLLCRQNLMPAHDPEKAAPAPLDAEKQSIRIMFMMQSMMILAFPIQCRITVALREAEAKGSGIMLPGFVKTPSSLTDKGSMRKGAPLTVADLLGVITSTTGPVHRIEKFTGSMLDNENEITVESVERGMYPSNRFDVLKFMMGLIHHSAITNGMLDPLIFPLQSVGKSRPEQHQRRGGGSGSGGGRNRRNKQRHNDQRGNRRPVESDDALDDRVNGNTK